MAMWSVLKLAKGQEGIEWDVWCLIDYRAFRKACSRSGDGGNGIKGKWFVSKMGVTQGQGLPPTEGEVEIINSEYDTRW